MTHKITVPQVAERFLAYWQKNPTWGCLHVALDDQNLDDRTVEWCVSYARREGDTEAAELGVVLLQMSKSQRRKVSDLPYQTAVRS